MSNLLESDYFEGPLEEKADSNTSSPARIETDSEANTDLNLVKDDKAEKKRPKKAEKAVQTEKDQKRKSKSSSVEKKKVDKKSSSSKTQPVDAVESLRCQSDDYSKFSASEKLRMYALNLILNN